MAGALTATAVRAARHPGGNGGGLYLQVAPGGTKSWLFRYGLAGKAREMGLGPVGEPPAGVPLAKARLLAAEARALLQRGEDPIEARRSAQAARRRAEAEARTFRAAALALALVESKRPGWRNAKHGKHWLATLETYTFP
jgi:hypothetical protein